MVGPEGERGVRGEQGESQRTVGECEGAGRNEGRNLLVRGQERKRDGETDGWTDGKREGGTDGRME